MGGLLLVPALFGGWRWLGAKPQRLKQARTVAKLEAGALKNPVTRRLALAALSR